MVDTNGVTLNIDVSVIYRVKPAEVGALYTEWAGAQLIDANAPGGDVEDRLVRPAVRSILPNSASTRNYLQIYATEKGKIQQEAEDALRTYLSPKHIDVVALQIREVYLPDTLIAGDQQQGCRAAIGRTGAGDRARRTRSWPRQPRNRPRARPSRARSVRRPRPTPTC